MRAAFSLSRSGFQSFCSPGIRPREIKRYQHADVGLLELNCQVLLDPEQSHSLLVYTAVPGSESYEKLQLLSVIGAASS